MSNIEEGRRVLRLEAQAILDSVEKLNGNFDKAVELILASKGKVVVTGMGKSGHVGKKIASTLSSTGTPAVFVHPAESSHGDMGTLTDNDVVIGISNSGESLEMAPILNFCVRRNIPVIGFTGNVDSALGKAGVTIDIGVKEEACPLGLAPTSSSTVTLALGDALAMALLKSRGFQEEDFAQFHPGGKLGRKLTTRVNSVMHKDDALPLVNLKDDMAKVISLMTSKDVRGVAGVIDGKGDLVGIITDGDIRRRLEKNNTPFTEVAEDLMSRNPKTIDHNELAAKALFVMEQFQIQILFAIDKSSSTPQKPLGLIHLQDLLRANIR